jgi:hypothetical protein
MLTAFRAIEVNGALLEMFLQRILRGEVDLTLDAVKMSVATLPVLSTSLIGREIDATCETIVMT